ncbi:MAG: YhdP family phospholipid transporter, partial [Gammaproteobacteria bacterium]
MLKPAITLSRHLWNFSAALLVAVALVCAVCRILLLQIDRHSGWVENWLTRTLDRPVTIGELEGHWRGWSPSIRIDSLTVYKKDQSSALVHFDDAVVELSISQSIKRNDLVPQRITLGGVRLTIERDVNGEFAVAGMPPSRWPVAQWIEGQQQFNLRNADIEFVDHLKGGEVHQFENLAVSIRRDAELRYITGHVSRQANLTEDWKFQITADDSLLGSQWSGKIALAGSNIQLPGLASNEVIRAFGLADHHSNVSLVSDWTNAKLTSAKFVSKVFDAAINTATKPARYVFSGNAARFHEGWTLGINVFEPGAGTSAAGKPATFRARWHSDESDVVWTVSDLKLEAFVPQTIALLQQNLIPHEILHKLNPRGTITNGMFLTTASSPLQPRAGAIEINSLSWQEIDDIPGVKDIDVKVTFNPNAGSLKLLPQNQIEVRSEKWLTDVVRISQVNGAVNWNLTKNRLVFWSKELGTNIESVELHSSGSISIDEQGMSLNLFSRIDNGKLARLRRLVPKNVFPAKGERWARRAFESGKINHGEVVFRGPLSKFPFDAHEGVFSVNVDAQAADVKYGAKWPIANDIGGLLSVNNRSVEFLVTAGNIYSSDVSGSIVRVDDLFTKKRYVQVSGNTQVIATEITKFINDSPLLKTKAKRFKELEISDPFELELDLNLGIFPGGDKDV